jgi:hypothetical protein
MVKKKKEKIKNRYIFGDKLAKMMSKVSMRTQLESSLFSQALLLLGMTIMIVFNILFSESGLVSKIMITFNLICAWVLIGSFLVTSFQQYQSHLNALGVDTDEERKKIKKRGNIFNRIAIARRNKRIKKKSIAPQLVFDALDNMKKIPKRATDEELEEVLKQMGENNNKK